MGNPQTQGYTYDALNRLRTAYAANGSTGNYASQAVPQQYTYNDTTGNLASKAGVNYTYGDAAHKHAVTSTSNGWAYQYDANGNMTRRDPPGSDYYDFVYDAENRLARVKKNNVLLVTFTYDGDGARIKAAINGGATTVFVGGHYEVTGSTVTKYYAAGGQRLALRQGSTLTYLLGDHLGSTSVSVAVGTPGTPKRQGYYPWGETRFATGTLPTKYQFIGQYSYATGATGDFGLMYYRARWYDPQLGRFAQADTVVPGGVQGLDRYAYVDNSPLNYTDPSGHGKFSGDDYDPGNMDIEQYVAYLIMSIPGGTTLQLGNLKSEDSANPTRLTIGTDRGGEKAKELFDRLSDACGEGTWSHPYCAGGLTVEEFLAIILESEFSTLGGQISEEDIQRLEAAAKNWFGDSCKAHSDNSGNPCQGATPNAVFNWIGENLESAMRLFSGGLPTEYPAAREMAVRAANSVLSVQEAPESYVGVDEPVHWGNASYYRKHYRNKVPNSKYQLLGGNDPFYLIPYAEENIMKCGKRIC